ncbi:peritrophin-48-like [Hyalella azteca]|uniref:Peritrophin-48-like n=1 Tax=Hyalella azteca TaxID=294128 RepID=A0A8B7NT49_HYAAZ|nr:peritrophin-48-like [Hyalella azteca]
MKIVYVMWTLAMMPAVWGWSACVPLCEGRVGAAVPDPSNCTQFYTCVDGVTPQGPHACNVLEYFNPNAPAGGACEPLSEAPVGYCTSPCSPCDFPCDIPGQILPDPFNCTRFSICLQTGELISQSCEADMYYDYINHECTTDVTMCYTSCTECTSYCTHPGQLIPDNADCTAFYYCEPPYKLHKTCPDGQNFDADTGVCSPDVECQQCLFNVTYDEDDLEDYSLW